MWVGSLVVPQEHFVSVMLTFRAIGKNKFNAYSLMINMQLNALNGSSYAIEWTICLTDRCSSVVSTLSQQLHKIKMVRKKINIIIFHVKLHTGIKNNVATQRNEEKVTVYFMSYWQQFCTTYDNAWGWSLGD